MSEGNSEVPEAHQKSDPCERPTSDRYVSEWEVIKSDRVEMCAQANELVGHFVHKQSAQFFADSSWKNVEVELTKAEQDSYESALRFLANQFDSGIKEAELHRKKEEVEVKHERTTT